MAAFRLVIQDGQPVVAEVRVFPYEEDDADHDRDPGEWSAKFYGDLAESPVGGLTSTLLKKVKFDVLDALPDIVGWVRTRNPEYTERLDRHRLAAEIRGRPRPGPKGPTDKELARLARQYAGLVRKRRTNPNQLLAESRGLGETPERIRDLILAARRRGILSPAPRGRPGGHLTEFGESLLQSKASR